MIPYLRTTDKNIINCNADLVILDSNEPILISLCDLHIKNKKICSDFISHSYGITLRDREDIFFEKSLYSGYNKETHYRYKSERMQNDLTHTIIYNTKINDYCINWNNEDKNEIITKYLRNIHYLPVTSEIVGLILEKDVEEQTKYKYGNYGFLSKCEVHTNNPMYLDLKVYKINVYYFKEKLNALKLEGYEEDFDWSKIEDIQDYIFAFLKPIKKRLEQNVRILYDPNNINPKIFEGKIIPKNGQIPVIQGALELLKIDRVVYFASEAGFGKTNISTKVNHCHIFPNKQNYVTLIVAPATTLTQWKDEIRDSISDKVDIHIIKKTSEFIQIYNKNQLQFNKPTYFLVGKETFKLDAKRVSGINIKTMEIKYKKEVMSGTGYYSYPIIKEVKEKITLACCPDCGKPLQNELRKKEDVFFTEKDFQSNPKKSNYKCGQCGAVLWQSTYDKTKKSSLIRFIKTKNVHFDSIICDEIHEQNNGESIIGSATRTLFNYTKKIILLSGTSNNGYSSSMHNLLLGIMSNKLKVNNVIDMEAFIKTYGTLMAISKKKDGEYHRSGRSEIKDSDYSEIEGINPIIYSKYLIENYIFSTLSDLKEDLPDLNEMYIPIKQSEEMERNEYNLLDEIKSANAFNLKMYENSIIKHYINNPFKWDSIEINKGEEYSSVQPKCIEDTILSKEQKLLDIILKEVSENRKCCVYMDFNNGGKYMKNDTISKRIESLLQKNNIKVFTLKSSVVTHVRKELLDKKKDDFQVLITNSMLVKVGLNLTYIPTYINYMPSYMVNDVDQSNRRGYRANSILENRIYHLYYENSCENGIIKRYQRKMAEKKAIEGKFNVNLENDENIRTASKLGKKISEGVTS
jgi:hypothetical protein